MVKTSVSPFFGEVAGGIVLFAAAVLAMLVVNLGGADFYHAVVEAPFAGKDIRHWINDGLMALFFVGVGIEIRREVAVGALRTWDQAMLPVAAAIGGVVVPVGVYLLATGGTPEWYGGAAVPMATDIAFVVALAAMLGPRVPASLKVFLLALAVADDLMAIGVIALVFTAKVVWANLGLALGLAALLMLKNRGNLRVWWVYVMVGVAMWLWVLHSGVHATLAGVILGALLPIDHKGRQHSIAEVFEHALAPWVRWGILPLFAFANMGIPLGASMFVGMHPVTWGIAMGLLAGKQAGVFASVWALERLKIAVRPKGVTWLQVYGAACLCGVGFTMSLFMASLALPHDLQDPARLGVLIGSVVSALVGVAVLARR